MSENTPNNDEIKRHKCPDCGADMVFDPGVGKLACPYCDAQKTIATNLADLAEQDLGSFLETAGSEMQPLASDALQVSCDSCGATVTFVPPMTATSCDFCAAKLVAQPVNADPLVAPKGVLPFSVENRDASAALRKWTATRWFAPNALKTMASHGKAESIYIPYWTFDADTDSEYTGQRGEDYQETEYYRDSNGNQQSRTHTKTNWYHTSGNTSRHFDDAPIPATTSVLPDYLNNLQFDFGELTSYDPAYLSGHKAQTYQVPLEDGFERFQVIAEGIIKGDVRTAIGGDRQHIDSVNTDYSNVTFKHILVPVYAGAYSLGEKSFQIIVNGRTGEVYGERPYSYLKIGCLVSAIIGALIFLFLLISVISAVTD